jgi:predicted kinase
MNPVRRVVVLVGLPGAGKSTYVERLGATALASDDIRRLLVDDAADQSVNDKVFEILHHLLRQRLALGRARVTYVDATNLTPGERRPYIDLAREFGCAAEAVFFDVPIGECMERNRRRSRVVPQDAMIRLAARLVPPSPEEGFLLIRVVSAGSAGRR